MGRPGLHRPLVLVILTLALAGCQSPPGLKYGTVYAPAAAAPPIALQTTDGEAFSLDQLQGKTALVYFGYTHCPDFCPATLATLGWMQDQLGERSDQVQVVFVTVDPAHDTQQVLQQYLDRFHPGMIGLTGDLAAIKTVLDDYGALASTTHDMPAELAPAVVAHTTRLFVVDPQGRLVANYPFDVDRQELLDDISSLVEATTGTS